MTNVLYISPFMNGTNYGGSIVSKNNFEALNIALSGTIKYVSFDDEIESTISNDLGYIVPSLKSNLLKVVYNFFLYPNRLDNKSLNKVKEIIIMEKPKYIYMDSSIYGLLCKWISKYHPKIKIITFFHNIEIDFEIQRLKKGDVKFLPSLFSVFFNERLSTKYSDYIITLHKSDSERLNFLYSKYADNFIPVSVKKTDFVKSSVLNKKSLTFGFVGSAFYANIEAAKFISKLADKLPDVNFIIAGKGFSAMANTLRKNNLKVIGELDDISEFYKQVDVFLAPIFSGAGMKVKIAEALSYNMPVIASSFSLVGYEDIHTLEHLHIANNQNEYLDIINKYLDNNINNINNISVFDEYYSFDSIVYRFSNIFKSGIFNENSAGK